MVIDFPHLSTLPEQARHEYKFFHSCLYDFFLKHPLRSFGIWDSLILRPIVSWRGGIDLHTEAGLVSFE